MRASLNEIEQLVGQPERGAVALYRLPDDNVFTLVLQRQSPLVVAQAYEAVDGAKGYVVAPFSLSAGTPLLVVPGAGHGMSYATDRSRYEAALLDFWKEFDAKDLSAQ